MLIRPNQLTGTIYTGKYTARHYLRNAEFGYDVYVPNICQNRKECALLFNHDGLNGSEALALELLAAVDQAPPCISIGIDGGILPPTLEGGKLRGLRMHDYDVFGPEFPAFVVKELIPWLLEKYNLSVSDSPDMHMVSGGSSGGVSSFNIAWYQTDYFRRVYMSSPSNLSMARGRELTALIRKYETKPIRVITEFSENEPDDYFGSSYCAADDVARALKFAGYDMQSFYNPEEGHCSRHHEFDNAYKRMQFFWKDWQTEPVRVTQLSPRAEKLISLDELWEEWNGAFPEKEVASSNGDQSAAGTYVAEGEDIYFIPKDGEKRKVAEGLGKITALAISSDRWLLYIGVLDRGCAYAMAICADGSLTGKFLHGSLHMETDFRHPGVYDFCIDQYDRLFAATESGIQCIRSFGLIDVILPLPQNAVPKKVAFGGEGLSYLYADCGDKIYRRKLKTSAKADIYTISDPQTNAYYD